MLFVQVVYVSLVCGPGVVFMSPAIVSRVRKTHKASQLPAHVAAAHER